MKQSFPYLLLYCAITFIIPIQLMAADIKTVKEKYQAELMAMPGVVSVGIGLAEGEKVIIIGLDGKHPETIPMLPSNLEGYAVKTQTTGTIKAQ